MDKCNIINISDVDSTNEYVLSLKERKIFQEGLVVVSDFQKKGRGQRGKLWESEKGKNLIISIVIEPSIPIKNQFDINKITCVAVRDFLFCLGVKSKIKWPNDILVNKNKIAGILIHNLISKGKIGYSVIGIGLNVNQLIFDNYIPKATSLAIECNKNFVLEELVNQLLISLGKRIKSYRCKKPIDLVYLRGLFEINNSVVFKTNSRIFNGIIRGVCSKGLLMVETEDKIKYFGLKEIEMVF